MYSATSKPILANCALLVLGVWATTLLLGCAEQNKPAQQTAASDTTSTTEMPVDVHGGTAEKDTTQAAREESHADHASQGDKQVKVTNKPPASEQPADSKMAKPAAKPSPPKPTSATAPADRLNDALRTACLQGDKETVAAKLRAGADVNAADQKGQTPLMLAAFNGHTAIVRTLLQHDAKVNVQNTEGRTALMYAASGPYAETVQLLLEHKAKVNTRDYQEKWTALMFAAAEGQAKVVKTLLNAGANPSLRDVDNDTAANFARNKGHTDVVQLLEAGPQKK